MAYRSKFVPDVASVRRSGSPDRRPNGTSAFSRFLLVGLGLVALPVLFLGGCAVSGRSVDPLSRHYESADVVGHTARHQIRGDETLLDLTRRFDLGYVELIAANPGIDPWIPGVGTRVLLPSAHLLPAGPRKGIVINLAEQRLYLFEADTEALLFSFPIGVSREGWTTPLGRTKVIRKRKDPIWYPTRSARREDPELPTVVRAGPENPLGTHALYLGWDRYLIHGTNEPDGVGRRVSRGCIRLYPEDIVRLFESTPVGAEVRVVHETAKLAWVGEDVFFEVHPSLDEMLVLEEEGILPEIRPDDLRPQIKEFAGGASDRIDWGLAYRVAADRRGVPVRITTDRPIEDR